MWPTMQSPTRSQMADLPSKPSSTRWKPKTRTHLPMFSSSPSSMTSRPVTLSVSSARWSSSSPVFFSSGHLLPPRPLGPSLIGWPTPA
jgi:hypothetical protein